MLLDHMYVHSHGSLYPMMDYILCIYYGLLTPCLLMFHGVPHHSITTSYCTRFVVLLAIGTITQADVAFSEMYTVSSTLVQTPSP